MATSQSSYSMECVRCRFGANAPTSATCTGNIQFGCRGLVASNRMSWKSRSLRIDVTQLAQLGLADINKI
jgi:hypothetical protein